MLKEYYRLAKPGIIHGNLISAIGGFLLASKGHFDWRLFLAMAVGTSLVIASACVFNNYRDSDIDSVMKRTKKRALASATIQDEYAFAYGVILGLIGFATLLKWTNHLTVFFGALGFVSYVWWYTSLKRKTEHAALAGSIPGATPIIAGYVTVTGHVDLGAVLLFIAMVIWQLPHFYAISMFRRDEYAAARVPVMAVARGMRATTTQIFWYVVAFAVTVSLLALYGYASFGFFVIMTLVSLYWLWIGLKGFRKGTDSVRWARKMFGASLLVLLAFSLLLSIDAWLP